MKSYLFIFLLFFSCHAKNDIFLADKKKFNSFYYSYDEKKFQSGINLIISEMIFGKSFEDSSFIKVYIQKDIKLDNHLKYTLHFKNSDTLKIVSIEDDLLIFTCKKFNELICKNEPLILLIENKCDKTQHEYLFRRKEGIQKFPKFH
jgi:hypothetical protein